MHDINHPNLRQEDDALTHMSTESGKTTLVIFFFNRTKILKCPPCSIDGIQLWRIDRLAIVIP